MDVFRGEEVLLSGISSKKGESPLTKAQQKFLYAACKATPKSIWLVYGLNSYKYYVEEENGLYQIKMRHIRADDEDPDSLVYQEIQKNRESREKKASTKLSTETYTQAGFKQEGYVKEFKEWREAFNLDLAELKAEIKNDSNFGKKLLEPEHIKDLENTFSHSIDPGVKGMHLRRTIISAFYADNRRVWSPGSTLISLLNGEYTKPVGYGGQFSDFNRPIELWYIAFDDLSRMTSLELDENIVYSIFKPLKLPEYGVVNRNSWPAFVFVRNESNKIRMYGMSAELAEIIKAVFNRQTG
jgi:hypothetical protein